MKDLLREARKAARTGDCSRAGDLCDMAGHPLDAVTLGRSVRRAAAALGLEVYGGDAIVTAEGRIVLIDVNAWPSFALYRDEAAPVIASYLSLRFGGGPLGGRP